MSLKLHTANTSNSNDNSNDIQLNFENILSQTYAKIYSIASNILTSHLFASDSYGNIKIFDIDTLASKCQLNVSSDPIYCLATHENFLISGSCNSIKFFNTNLENLDFGKMTSEFFINTGDISSNRFKYEINDIIITNDNNNVLTASSHGKVYGFDLNTGDINIEINAHEDSSIYCLEKYSSNIVLSSSEDGSVALWDLRDFLKPIARIYPYKETVLVKNSNEKYINTLKVDENGCIICGGGPNLSLWHMHTYSMVTSFLTSGTNTSCVGILGNKVNAGTTNGKLYQWDFSGRYEGSCNTDISSVLTLHTHTNAQNNEVLFVGGIGPNICVFTRNLLCLKKCNIFP